MLTYSIRQDVGNYLLRTPTHHEVMSKKYTSVDRLHSKTIMVHRITPLVHRKTTKKEESGGKYA